MSLDKPSRQRFWVQTTPTKTTFQTRGIGPKTNDDRNVFPSPPTDNDSNNLSFTFQALGHELMFAQGSKGFITVDWVYSRLPGGVILSGVMLQWGWRSSSCLIHRC